MIVNCLKDQQNMQLTPKQKQDLQAVADKHSTVLIILFGSRAEGRAREDSDFDVAVLSGREFKKISPASLIKDLTEALGRDIDLTLLNRADPLIKFRVARSGILLYGKKKDLTGFKVRAISEYLDTNKLFDREFQYIKKKLNTFQ